MYIVHAAGALLVDIVVIDITVIVLLLNKRASTAVQFSVKQHWSLHTCGACTCY